MSSFIAVPSPANALAASSSQQHKTPFRCSGHHFGAIVIPRTRPTPLPNLSLDLSKNRTAHVCAAVPGFPGPGEEETKGVVDAFFLGKAAGEALTERIEASVGEFLSIIGRLQAEQQKKVQEFREDVMEKAKRAKEQAVCEAMKSKGLVQSSPAFDANAASNVTTMDATTPIYSTDGLADESDPESSNKGPLIGISTDD